MNLKSNIIAANTFCVIASFRPQKLPWFSIETDAQTQVPSIAPKHPNDGEYQIMFISKIT